MATSLKAACDNKLQNIGRRLARKLNAPTAGYKPYAISDFEVVCQTMQVGDVLLVEGRERVSGAIKYLTQSTWSHAALYVGNRARKIANDGEQLCLVEVDLHEGCISVPLSKYANYNTRICRPIGLDTAEREKVAQYMLDNIGLKYDLRNIFDLFRYFFPTPPVPVRWRRRMLSLGSGDPTRAICSSLIARSFQSVKYPILPDVTELKQITGSEFARREIYHIRHHSLFAPRDFDLSPWFQIIKPGLDDNFDRTKITWET
ncbi:YiiX/YebB-like N1pC/P60 family cysteine hydrolase [Falsihalocynthiibacter arcticus]|uniref:Lipo-like protein n=1 Tax=Falsihalocynthiibacter arcticus TaxID=1579316 RepID=A0A126V582_9RHOB|nr:YiiX/YebB-like N1pC/P60 family cysteine hydrolase [Falsihalocynthiibacter arcticus]AML53036.1 lipo-like protein [Falsihalocynthiibacter arcticus]